MRSKSSPPSTLSTDTHTQNYSQKSHFLLPTLLTNESTYSTHMQTLRLTIPWLGRCRGATRRRRTAGWGWRGSAGSLPGSHFSLPPERQQTGGENSKPLSVLSWEISNSNVSHLRILVGSELSEYNLIFKILYFATALDKNKLYWTWILLLADHYCTFSFWLLALMILAANIRPDEFSLHLWTCPKRPLMKEKQTHVCVWHMCW